VVPGTYPVTVQGAGGSLTRTAVITVTVAAGPSVSLSVTPATLSIEQGGSGHQPFEDDGAAARAGGVNRGGEAGATTADNGNVVLVHGVTPREKRA